MADNTLATQIQVPQFDVMNPLLKAAQLRNLQAEGGLKEQDLKYRQGVLDRNDQYYPSDINTLEEARQKHLDNMGRVGNILSTDQSPAARDLAIQTTKQMGYPISPDMEQHIRTAPAGTVQQYGRSLQQGAQPSATSIEQGGQPSYNRAYGTRSGELSGGLAPAPNNGPAQPGQGGGPTPPSNVSLSEKAGAAAASGAADQAQLVQYRKEQEAAGVAKAGLQQLKEDAARVRTGAGAEKEQAARKWLVALGDTVPGMKGLADKFSTSTAAFESLDKNAGIISREVMKTVGGTAASELDAISRSLVSSHTTNKGIDVNASQLIGMQNYNHARAAAAEDYYQSGTLRGFVTQFNKNSGPAAWIYMALPQEERQSIRDSLNKTDDGKRILNSLGRQIDYIHKHKMDEGLD